ncbi:hypothetical protein ACFV3R_30645 [Streptomyces sp. NPDC059740]|uniref:hypothetical protein n=1 Tax=Streptomyces sp. NPDC059740 TaxID=3346926 RepID=UPI003668A476
MDYIGLEAWVGGEWLELEAVSVTVQDSILTLSFERQHTEQGYRSLVWEPLEHFLREYRDEPVVVMPYGRNLPVMFGPGAAGPFRLRRITGH